MLNDCVDHAIRLNISVCRAFVAFMRRRDKEKPDEVELRVLDEDEEDVLPEEVIEPEVEENVEVLEPETKAAVVAKTYEPDISAILDVDDGAEDVESGWGGKSLTVSPIGWFILAGLLVIVITTWAIVAIYYAQPELKTIKSEKVDLSRESVEEKKKVRKTLDAMEHAIRGYLEAETISEMNRHVRHPKRVKPLMEKYYSKYSIRPFRYQRLIEVKPLGLENHAFVQVKALLQSGNTRMFVLQQVDNEKFAVDWEADVSYQPISWGDFIKERPVTSMDMRVFMKPDNFYAYEFRDDEAFDCYHLSVRDGEGFIFGFVRKESQVALALRKYVMNNRLYDSKVRAQPLMLRLRFPEGAQSNKCVWIDALIAPRWILLDNTEGR